MWWPAAQQLIVKPCSLRLSLLSEPSTQACGVIKHTLANVTGGCRYTVSELGPAFVGEMRKHLASRTYAQAKPRTLTDEQWWVHYSLADLALLLSSPGTCVCKAAAGATAGDVFVHRVWR